MGKKSEKVIFHIDVNSAYLSWEAAERLKNGETEDLRDIMSVVGGDPQQRKGIVLSKSLPCKPYKIQTGESIYSAMKKCPGLKVVPARFKLYEQYSHDMMELLSNYSDRVQQYSIDEAFVDYTYMEEHFGPPVEAADRIRRDIKEKLGFTVCVGVSSNKLLAKMATELRKPDATNTLFPGEIEKMWALPIEELFMAGRATAPKLRQLGINTIGDLAKFDRRYLTQHFQSFGTVLWQYANGIDESIVDTDFDPAKSIGNSTTIPYDVTSCDQANLILLSLCEMIGKRLRECGYCTTVISVGIRNSGFQYYSHQKKISSPTNCTTDIFNYVQGIFKEGWKGEPVRQLGVRTAGLCGSGVRQLSFFDSWDMDKKKALDRAVDGIRGRFGDDSVVRASFLCGNKKEDHQLDKFSPFRSTGGL